MVDNATGERMKLPEINITKKEEIKVATPVKDENGNINGLIGLDVLLELGVSIDLKNLKLKL